MNKEKIVENRVDGLFIFDVKDGNPNGSPDQGNLPRVRINKDGSEYGFISDVAIKHKIRMAAQEIMGGAKGNQILYKRVGKETMQDAKKIISDEAKKEGVSPVEWVCSNFFDVRCFGAVLTEEGTGGDQVTGAIQVSISNSIHPIDILEYGITKCIPTKMKSKGNQESETGRMGSKSMVFYGVYVGTFHIYPKYAKKNGLSEKDISVLLECLEKMFWVDSSAARGEMNTRGIYLLKHSCELGDCQVGRIREIVSLKYDDKVKSFNDVEIVVNEDLIPQNSTFKKVL